ncbi:MAG TPA: hypothetical protein VNX68_03470 [Nitrosopumilaceae archaeon]|jgi:hypothetical protein|nr:hypothetical protein [Nitrosopumilaceae archaeon]
MKTTWEIQLRGCNIGVTLSPETDKTGVREVLFYEDPVNRFAGGGSSFCTGQEFLDNQLPEPINIRNYILKDLGQETLDEIRATIEAYSAKRPENIPDLEIWLHENYDQSLQKIRVK